MEGEKEKYVCDTQREKAKSRRRKKERRRGWVKRLKETNEEVVRTGKKGIQK